MRLPGTRYQEHGWEQVRKLLGHCSLQAFRQLDLRPSPEPAQRLLLLDQYVDATAAALRSGDRLARAEAAGNSYGDTVQELAMSLLFELRVQPAFWHGLLEAVPADWQDAMLRKKVNDMYAGLRDKVDADHYVVATGRDCSPNKIYTYRMLDTAYHEIAGLFAAWQQHLLQVGAILGRSITAMPIEARQMKSIAGCKAEWVIRWSATLEQFQGSPGPLHTRSKRFASLKNSADKIAAMLAEIGDYEELSANMDRSDDWYSDAGEAALWMEDYWRVISASEQQGEQAGVADQFLPPPEEEALAEPEDDLPDWPPLTDAQLQAEQTVAGGLSLPPNYLEVARTAQQAGSWTLRILAGESLPIRLAVYHQLLGSRDDSYPAVWLDPATGELPTLQQLAALDQISMPTMRKRRNEAIDKLYAAGRDAPGPRRET